MMAEALRSLPFLWETWTEFWDAGFSLTQPWFPLFLFLPFEQITIKTETAEKIC